MPLNLWKVTVRSQPYPQSCLHPQLPHQHLSGLSYECLGQKGTGHSLLSSNHHLALLKAAADRIWPCSQPITRHGFCAQNTCHWLHQTPPPLPWMALSRGLSQVFRPHFEATLRLLSQANNTQLGQGGGTGTPLLLEHTWGRCPSSVHMCESEHKLALPTTGATHFLPDLPLTRSSQGWSSGRNSFRTMPYFFRRASSRSFRLNSLPAPDSGISSSW